MENILGATLFIAVSTIAIGACTRGDVHSLIPNSGLQVTDITTGVMAPCSDSLAPTNDDITRIVRVVVPNPLDPLNMLRKVTYQNPIGGQDPEAAEDGVDSLPGGDINDSGVVGDPYHDNPFHIDMTRLKPRADGKPDVYVMVRILLDPTSKYTFYDQPDKLKTAGHPAEPGVHGVGWGGKINNLDMCDGHIHPVKDGTNRQVAIFYVNIKPKGLQATTEGVYNFGVVPGPYQDTVVFIDPKVKNPG